MAGEFSTSKNKYVHYKSRNVEGNEEIDFGLALEKVSLGPRKKLLVMNLGGLLCQRVCRREVHNIPRFRHPDASYGSMLVYKRPYCEEFMKFCLQRFEVGIWSSAR
ncbi:HAD-like domain containing protein, partial [Fagus crenata]